MPTERSPSPSRGSRVGGEGGDRHGVLGVPEAALAAKTGERLVDGDPREPGREAGASGELYEVRVGADVGVLDHVGGLVVVACDGARGAEEALVVAAHDDLEECGVATADAGHDLVVGEGGVDGLGDRGVHGLPRVCVIHWSLQWAKGSRLAVHRSGGHPAGPCATSTMCGSASS
jgi:hypothetical protein